MPSVYVALSGKDVDEALLKAKGIKVEGRKEEKVATKVCGRCGEINSVLSSFCKKCCSPLDIRAHIEMQRFEQCVVELFREIGRKFPSLKKKFVKIVREQGLEHLFS
jgi:ribosomal protein L40E